MFAKLLKYEWKASAGLLGILSGAALGIGLLGGLTLRFIFSELRAGDEANILVMPAFMMLFFMVLALFAYLFAVQLVLLVRFYKSRFTDEGYLTFTLPVTTTQSYLAALSNILIWNVISGAVMAITSLFLVFLGLSEIAGAVGSQVTVDFGILFGEVSSIAGYAEYQLLSLINTLVTFVSQPVIIMACITLGAVLAKKHKMLAAIGIYYGVSMAVGMVTSVGNMAMMLEEIQISDVTYSAMLPALGIQIAVQLALCVGGSALSIWLMEKKLNLP